MLDFPRDVSWVVFHAMIGLRPPQTACFCPACWDSATGVAVLEPAAYCESWRRDAEEWLWASSLFDCIPMEIDSSPTKPKIACNLSAACGAVAQLSDEIWLHLFLFVSNDCPSHSFSALSELSAVTKRSSSALRCRRAEHLRLLNIDLEVDKMIDIEMHNREQDRKELDAFEDAWSIDSDGHWRDRFYDRYYDEGSPRPFAALPSQPQDVLLQRRLELAVGLPIFPTLDVSSPVRHDRFGPLPPLFSRSPVPSAPASMEVPRLSAQPFGFQGQVGSPNSVASTISCSFDPTSTRS